MALMYKYLPVEYQYKFETCVLNIKNKPGLSLIIAAACHEQLQMLTDYVNNTIDNNIDLTVLHLMLDTFIALTYQLRLTATECALSELSMLRCFNQFAISLLKINQDTGLQTEESAQEYAILNEEYLMAFYKIDEPYYSPCSPSNFIPEHEEQSKIIFNSTEDPVDYIILD